jgi:hypothetical protein
VNISLWIQKKNQVERRHGEIIQLRTQLLSAVTAMRNQTVKLLMQAETFRMELRKIPDCDMKYDTLDLIPGMMKNYGDHKAYLDDVIAKIEKTNTKELNRSSVLITFQNFVPLIEASEKSGRILDDQMLEILEGVRRINQRDGQSQTVRGQRLLPETR